MSSLKKKDISAINKIARMSRMELESISSISSPLSDSKKTIEENNSIVEDKTIVEQTTTSIDVIPAQKNEILKITKPEPEVSQYEKFIMNTKKNIVDVDVHLLDPAPNNWNIFPKLSESKITQLVFSIENSGLFDPVILWEKENGRYMILSGHNRVAAFQRLLQEYSDDDTYTRIPSIIYQKGELTQEQAKEIIIDTNFIQRGDFNPRLRAKILQARKDIYTNQTDKKGRNIKEITRELGLKKSAIYEDFTIIEKTISSFQDLYYDGVISRKSILRIATLSFDLQEIIASDYSDKITDRKIASIQRDMTEEDIRTIFESKNNFAMEKTVKVRIPSNRYEEFMAMYNQFIAEYANEGLVEEKEES